MSNEKFTEAMIETGRKIKESAKMYYIPETGIPEEYEWREIDINECKDLLTKCDESNPLIWEHEGVEGLVLYIMNTQYGIPGLFIPLIRLTEFNVKLS